MGWTTVADYVGEDLVLSNCDDAFRARRNGINRVSDMPLLAQAIVIGVILTGQPDEIDLVGPLGFGHLRVEPCPGGVRAFWQDLVGKEHAA